MDFEVLIEVLLIVKYMHTAKWKSSIPANSSSKHDLTFLCMYLLDDEGFLILACEWLV
jgi:hypothetical protein